MARDVIDWVALDRYVAGEGSPAEREEMRRRIMASSELAAIVDVMRSAHRESTDASDDVADAAAAWRSLSARLDRDVARPTRRHAPALTLIPSSPQGAGRAARITGWAAAILLIAGASYASWREFRPPVRSQAQAPAIRAVYATTRGERATVELRDGTRVTLAPETEMRVAAIGRQVYLSGEAVFSVTHDPARAFRVIAPNGVIVQDIGTQFDMRAYATDKAVRVAVGEGSVSLRGSAEPVILERGTLGIIDSAGATRIIRAPVDGYLAWAQGHLTFTNARMADVVPELSRWFDLDVRLGSQALADDRLTVSLNDVPADAALDAIARALDARVARTGQTVTLYPRTREGTRE